MATYKKLFALILVSCCKLYSIDLEKPSGVYKYPGNGYNVNNVQLLRNGEVIIAFDEDHQSLSFRDKDSGTDIVHIPLPEVSNGYIGSALRLSSAKNKIAAGQWDTDEVQVIDLEKRAIIASVYNLKQQTTSRCSTDLSWSLDDNLLGVSMEYPMAEYSTVPMSVYDLRSGKRCCEYTSPTLFTAHLSPNGKEILLGNTSPRYRSSIFVYDIRNKLVTKEFSTLDDKTRPQDVTAIEFSKDGSKFAVSNSGVFLGVADTYERIERKDFPGFFHQVAFNSDGTLLAVLAEDGISIVTIPEMQCIKKLDPGYYLCLQLHWDGNILAAACNKDNSIKTWDLSGLNK